jgi:hypothetical protein
MGGWVVCLFVCLLGERGGEGVGWVGGRRKEGEGGGGRRVKGEAGGT